MNAPMRWLSYCLFFPGIAIAQEPPPASPESGPASQAASTSPAASNADPDGEDEETRYADKYKDYVLLISSWSGSSISQLQPNDPQLLAPLGGSVFSDTVILGGDATKDVAVGGGVQFGGSLGIDFEKQPSFDAYLGVGPGLRLGKRLALAAFGGGGVDGVGLLSEDPALFHLAPAAYGYVSGKGNLFLTEHLALDVSASRLARVGAIDELRLVGRLLWLSSSAFRADQTGTAFGFAYTEYEDAAESFSVLWSLAR